MCQNMSGLSTAEVEFRKKAGLSNESVDSSTKTVAQIIRSAKGRRGKKAKGGGRETAEEEGEGRRRASSRRGAASARVGEGEGGNEGEEVEGGAEDERTADGGGASPAGLSREAV